MSPQIRKITEADRAAVLTMMQEFYSSPAVSTDGSEEIFGADIDTCLSDSPYLEGYVFDLEGTLQGYAMLAKSFSTEFGKRCIWIEDLFLTDEARGCGIGKTFFDYITKKYDGAVFRLEVEAENERAVKLYERCGFTTLPYMEMKK